MAAFVRSWDLRALTEPMPKAALFAGKLPVSEDEILHFPDMSADELVLSHYDAEHRSLRRYLAYLGVADANAQEIVQETFLKLHVHLLGKGNRQNLKGWLYRVAHNLAKGQQSSSWHRRTDSMDAPRGSVPERSHPETPESLLLSRERDQRFRQAMERLSSAQRACLALRAEGFKYREIAEVLELSPSTVGENIQRALENLKELL